MLKSKALKTLAILDFVFDVLLIASVWVLVSNNHKLKIENDILKNEAIEQENQIIEKDNYIDYLETIAVEAEKVLYK